MTPQNPANLRKTRRIAGKESRLSQETAWLRSCRFLFYPLLPGTKPALPQGTRNDAHRGSPQGEFPASAAPAERALTDTDFK